MVENNNYCMKMTEPKYSKKTSFDRNKKYAYYESDIAKNDKKIEDYKNVRSMERERNLKIANGVIDANGTDASDKDVTAIHAMPDRVTAMPAMHAMPEPPFYYEKMNFIIHGMHSSAANHDAILRDFMPYGEIIYLTQMVPDENGCNKTRLVIDHWYDEPDIDMTYIIEVQNAIFKTGKYDLGQKGSYITKDPTQSLKDMGCKIVLDDN